MKKYDNKEVIKKKIAEKEKEKIEYDEKIGNIKVSRGINFSVNYLKDENINSIVFQNLKYKNKAKNVSIFYNGSTRYFNAITYEPSLNTQQNYEQDISFIEKIKKEYKLKLVVEELEKANLEYRNKLIEIDKKYQEINNENNLSDDDIELRKSIKKS